MTKRSNLFIKLKVSSIHLGKLDEKITLEDDLAYKMTNYLLQK